MTNDCSVTIKTDKNVERTRTLVRTDPCLGYQNDSTSWTCI